jgi:hypothetical protein
VAVAGQRPGDPPGHPVADDAGGGRRGDVEHHDVRGPELLQRAHGHPGLHLRAVLGQQCGDRPADGRRSALGHRPAVPVRGRAERHADRRGRRGAEGPECMGGDAGEQRPRLRCRPPPREDRRRQHRVRAEAGQLHRMPRHMQQGPEEVLRDVVEASRERPEEAAPALPVRSEPTGRLVDRPPDRRATAAVQGVGPLDVRPSPGQPVRREVEGAGEGRVDGQRMEGRALVVDESGQRENAAAGPAPDRVRGLQHRDPDAGSSKGEGGSEPVGPAADHDGFGHALTLARTAGWGCSPAGV